jgi:hypothetical protein
MLAAAAASASAAARLLLRMKINASPAITANPMITAATAIPAIAPVLSPDEEFCDAVTVPVADTAPTVPVIAEDEVDTDEDVEEEVEEEEDEEVLVELGAADDVPGKPLRGMAWNVMSVGF